MIVIVCAGCGVFQIEPGTARLGPFSGKRLAAVRGELGGPRGIAPWRGPLVTAERVAAALERALDPGAFED